MRLFTLVAVPACLLLSNDGQASTITQNVYVEKTIDQTGRYVVDVGFFRGVDHGWRWRTPDRGSGYNWDNWYLTFNNLDIPEGSTLNSAVLAWDRVLWEPSWHWDNRPQDFSCKSGGFCIGSTMDRVDLDTWTNMVFVESGGRKNWFPVPEPRDPTGSFDLLAMGFGQDILSSKYVTLVGALQLSLGRVYLDEGWNAHNEFDWQAKTRMGMSAELLIDFTPPSNATPGGPSSGADTPEPATFAFLGVGLLGIGVYRKQKRHTVSANLSRDHSQ